MNNEKTQLHIDTTIKKAKETTENVIDKKYLKKLRASWQQVTASLGY